MVSTRTPDAFVEFVAARLASYQLQGRRLTLALSGGVDSVVLLDVLAQLRATSQFHLSALYVNHGLSTNAGTWGRFCADLCQRLSVPFSESVVRVMRSGGDSLEARAREARYRVFVSQATDYLVLAHHLDDQAETVLLQLLRGAGLKGLSAMPESRTVAGGAEILRPLLEVGRAEILAYAESRGLAWIEDESNRDTAYGRNFLRQDVFPMLAQYFPGYRQALLRTSRHAAEAAVMLDEMAAKDGAAAISDGRLDIGVLHVLPLARAKNVLRWFLEGRGVTMPSAVRLNELLRQLVGAAADAQVHVHVGGHDLRRYRNLLYVLPRKPAEVPVYSVAWTFQDSLEIPGGMVHFEWCRGKGMSLSKLRQGKLEIRNRAGIDRLRPDCRRPSRSLKNLLQESGVPPWERGTLPLLYCGGRLAWGARIGIDCAFQATEDEQGVLAIYAPLL